jgi:bifunctional N-acetylglucosamine-1-phosphate-uridyltransferase/glucosamine-1-phosphate-acetyltransferase GlmU-like protein
MAAGLGTRMRSALPKHLHPLLGRRLADWVVLAAEASPASTMRASRPAASRTIRP